MKKTTQPTNDSRKQKTLKIAPLNKILTLATAYSTARWHWFQNKKKHRIINTCKLTKVTTDTPLKEEEEEEERDLKGGGGESKREKPNEEERRRRRNSLILALRRTLHIITTQVVY